MTCRVARSYQYCDQMEPVCCSKCGSASVSVPVVSRTLGPNLCSICAQSVSPRLALSAHAPREPMRHRRVA